MNRFTSIPVLVTLLVSPAIQAQMSTVSGTEETETNATVSTFEELSPGNQKIARALMDAQQLPENGSGQILTLDQIATAGSEMGWGKVFLQMQSEGRITARNLGQVVSSYQHNTASATNAGSAAFGSVTAAEHANGHARGNNTHAAGVGVGSGASTGLNISSANGNAFGSQGTLPVSAGHGITTATGAGASIGSSHALNTGISTNAANHAGFGAGINTSTGANSTISSGAAGLSVSGAVNAVGNTQGQVFGQGK